MAAVFLLWPGSNIIVVQVNYSRLWIVTQHILSNLQIFKMCYNQYYRF